MLLFGLTIAFLFAMIQKVWPLGNGGPMEVTQKSDCGPRPVPEPGSLLVLALLPFAVGGTSGL
jgi:hypothetical protein